MDNTSVGYNTCVSGLVTVEELREHQKIWDSKPKEFKKTYTKDFDISVNSCNSDRLGEWLDSIRGAGKISYKMRPAKNSSFWNKRTTITITVLGTRENIETFHKILWYSINLAP